MPDPIIDINYNARDAVLRWGGLAFREGQFAGGGKKTQVEKFKKGFLTVGKQ